MPDIPLATYCARLVRTDELVQFLEAEIYFEVPRGAELWVAKSVARKIGGLDVDSVREVTYNRPTKR